MQHSPHDMMHPRYGEWFYDEKRWLIRIRDRKTGDIVPARRRSGSLSYHELEIQVAPGLYASVRNVPDAEIPPNQLIAFDPAPDSTYNESLRSIGEPLSITP